MIDAHQHCWQIGRHGCTWPGPDIPAIHADFLPTDWKDAATDTPLTGSILVQSQPSLEDTEWLLQLAAVTPSVLGVVGWVDLSADDAVAQIDRLACDPLLRGLRPMLQSLPTDDWILQDACAPALDRMAQLGLTFDALVFPRHLPVIDQLAARHSDLAIIIDHGAKPQLECTEQSDWIAAMSRIARHDNVLCKWSGLATELGRQTSLKPVIEASHVLLDTFGKERLIWGSDWPVCTLRISLSAWLRICLDLAPDAESRAAIFFDNAVRAYKLP